MNAEIQNNNELQRAVVEVLRSHPVRETKYGNRINKEDQDRRLSALQPVWRAFLSGAKNEAERLRRQLLLSEINHLPWYLGPEAEEMAEAYFSRAAALKGEKLAEQVSQVQSAAEAQAEGAAYIEQSRQADALALLPAKERQAITREKRLAYALREGAVPAEKGLVHLFWQGSRADRVSLVQGRIDYRVLWTMAVCAKRLLEEGRGVAPTFSTAEELERKGTELQSAASWTS